MQYRVQPSTLPSFTIISIQQEINEFLALDEQGDFKIRAGEGLPAVTVHRSILAARSGFFRALLEAGMGDSSDTELTLKVACA